MPTDPIQNNGFKKLDDDLSFLIQCFTEVLEEIEDPTLAKSLPWVDSYEEPSENDRSWRLGQAYTISFQLLNMVEENVALHVRRQRETASKESGEKGLWYAELDRLRKLGLSLRTSQKNCAMSALSQSSQRTQRKLNVLQFWNNMGICIT